MKCFRKSFTLALTLLLSINIGVLAIGQTTKDNSNKTPSTKDSSKQKLEKEDEEKLAQNLVEAILSADNNEVKKLIAKGIDLNNGKYPFLAMAVGMSQLEMVTELLQAGANVNLELDEQATALTVAFFMGNVEITKKLLSVGGKLFIEHNEEESNKSFWLVPLTNLDIEPEKYLDLLEIALSQGANPNEQLGDGRWTPLMQAASQGNLPVVDLLLKAKADVKAKSSNGVTPCSCAVSKGHLEIVKRLNAAGADCDINQKISKKSIVQTAFGTVLVDGEIDEADLGGPVIKDFKEDLLDFIRRAGRDIDLEASRESQVKEIIDNNDVNARYEAGNTILMLIASENFQESKKASSVIDALIQAGADINIKNDQGDTALLIASRQHLENSFIFKKLISAGADVRVRDNKGKTLLINLIENNSVLDELSNLGQWYYGREVVEELVKAGVDVNAKDNSGKTALMYAVELQDSKGLFTLPFAKKLLDLGANPSIKDKKGK